MAKIFNSSSSRRLKLYSRLEPHLDHSEIGSVDGIAAWAGQEIRLTLHHAVKDAPRNAQSFHEIAI